MSDEYQRGFASGCSLAWLFFVAALMYGCVKL